MQNYYVNSPPQTQQNLPRVQNVSCALPPTKSLGGLYIGNYFGAQNVQVLKQYGIRAVLTTSIQTPVVYLPEDIPFHKRIDAHDKQNFYIKDHFQQCLQFIQQCRKVTNVFVHCYAGMSRSAAMVIAYIMKTHNWSYQKTLNFLKYKRSIVNPNEGFVIQLKQFQKQLSGIVQQPGSQNFQTSTRIQLNNQSVKSNPFIQSSQPNIPNTIPYQIYQKNNQQTYSNIQNNQTNINNNNNQISNSPKIQRVTPYYDLSKNYYQNQQPERSNSAENPYNTGKYIYSGVKPQQQFVPQIISTNSQLKMYETTSSISTKSGIRTFHQQIPIPKFGLKKQILNLGNSNQKSKIIKEIPQDPKKIGMRQSKAGLIRPKDLPGYRIT